VLILKKTSQ